MDAAELEPKRVASTLGKIQIGFQIGRREPSKTTWLMQYSMILPTRPSVMKRSSITHSISYVVLLLDSIMYKLTAFCPLIDKTADLITTKS